jgi:hypothetical protein
MLTREDLEAIRLIIDAALDARGLDRKPRTAAQRQKEYRERKLLSVTVSKQKSNAAHRDGHNKNVTRLVTEHNTTDVALRTDAWVAYSASYQTKYGVPPVRNAKVNAQLVQFCKRVGRDAVPMATWYVTHGAARYVHAGHSLGLLLMDAEKLHTEWETGLRMTSTAAQLSDRTQATGDVFHRLISEVRRDGKIT